MADYIDYVVTIMDYITFVKPLALGVATFGPSVVTSITVKNGLITAIS